MNYERPELLERLAAEYALGTMTRLARARFEALRRTLPAADQAARAWEHRLAPLSSSVPAAVPSAQVWDAIDRRTGGGAPARAGQSRFWTWLGPALGLAFGVLGTVAVVRLEPAAVVPIDEIVQQRGTLPQSYVGLLTNAAGEPVILASSMRHGRELTIKVLKKIDVPPGSVLVLWALPADGPPFALGPVPAEGKGTVVLADTSEKLLSKVSRLAASIETAVPAPGSAPAPFLLLGHCVKLW